MSLSVHITKKVGDFLLQADCETAEGITGILGASGCGKSMTLKCIAGIIKPDKGKIVLNGRVLFDSERHICVKPQERHVGYLFQNYALFPNMTVEQNILCGLCQEKSKEKKQKKLEEVLQVMELQEVQKNLTSQLSGGQQQRAALARILVSDPELLLLDEPFSALDAYLREQLQTKMLGLLRKFGKEVLMVSHSRDEIYYLCDQAAVMGKGKILTMGRTKDVFADPGSQTAAILTGCKNVAAAKKTGSYEVYVPKWGIHLTTAEPVREDVCAVGLRAHYFAPFISVNRYPVKIAAFREEPFEYTVQFRYEEQAKDEADLWWRFPKNGTEKIDPEALGIEPKDVLLLYPEV